MSRTGEMIERGQTCKAFDCRQKDTCIFKEPLCEYKMGCPHVFEKSICKTCSNERFCIYKERERR